MPREIAYCKRYQKVYTNVNAFEGRMSSVTQFPATDRALAAAKIDWGENEAGTKLGKKLARHRNRIDAIRIALGTRAQQLPPKSFAIHPATRVSREARS